VKALLKPSLFPVHYFAHLRMMVSTVDVPLLFRLEAEGSGFSEQVSSPLVVDVGI